MPPPRVSETQVRVNYSETDQMGVVYHARYLVWLDVARTEHLRLSGMSYRELEAAGLRLAVCDISPAIPPARQVRRRDSHAMLGPRRRHTPGGFRLRRGGRGPTEDSWRPLRPG